MTKFQEDQIWLITQELRKKSNLRNEYDKVLIELEKSRSFSILPYFEKMNKAYDIAVKNLKENYEDL